MDKASFRLWLNLKGFLQKINMESLEKFGPSFFAGKSMLLAANYEQDY